MPRPATARALTPTLLWSLDKACFDELLLGEFRLEETLTAQRHRRAKIHHPTDEPIVI